MALDASELARHRQLRAGEGTPEGGPDGRPKVEDVVRMYSDEERMAVIGKEAVKIKVGTPEKEIMLYPLSLRQVILFLPKMKSVLGPVLLLFKERRAGDPPVPIAAIIEALSEKVEELPDVLMTIFSRGNGDVDKDWLLDHLDLVPDMQTVMPIFLRQNGLEKLLNLGKAAPPSSSSSSGDGGRKGTDQAPVQATTDSPEP